MEQLKPNQLMPQDIPADQGHWNDYYLARSTGEPDFSFVNPHLSTQRTELYKNELKGQHFSVWEEQQALLGMALAKLDGRESEAEQESLTELSISSKFINKLNSSSYSLVEELYERMGPVNELGRGDVLLISLASLVAGEDMANNMDFESSSNKDLDTDESDKFFQRVTGIFAYTEKLRANPELGEGIPNESLLAAELISDALHVPSPIRSEYALEGFYNGDLDASLTSSVVTLCDSALANYAVKLGSLEGNNSKTSEETQKRILARMSRAILTKYDVLFDRVKDDDGGNDLLGQMVGDIKKLMPDLKTGFLYELFMPMMYRYIAHQEGHAVDTRIWHATVRGDMPKDKVGNRIGNKEHVDRRSLALSESKSVAHDALQVFDGKITQRLQLKARTDAGELANEYDERLVKVHSKDAEKLLLISAVISKKLNPNHDKLTNKERVVIYDTITGEILRALINEVGARIKDGKSLRYQSIQVNGQAQQVEIGNILDEVVIPQYRKLLNGYSNAKAIIDLSEKELVNA